VIHSENMVDEIRHPRPGQRKCMCVCVCVYVCVSRTAQVASVARCEVLA